MRFVVFGAGAVGGVLGARLAENGHGVILIARGAHYKTIKHSGLRIESPDGEHCLEIPVVEHPAQIAWAPDDIVLLTMKTQDTLPAIRDLSVSVRADVPVVCVQNAVENERIASRFFERVYGVCVMCPAAHLEPGVVQAWCTPVTGALDIGRYPAAADEISEEIAMVFRASNFSSESRRDIMRWKYNKLLMNLGNAVQAICGSRERSSEIAMMAWREGVACLQVAGIDYVSEEEDKARRDQFFKLGTISGKTREGGSTWQSLKRQTHSVEADYLNGEISLLGRLHGIATPVNALLQRVVNEMAREGRPPGSISIEELTALLPGRV